MSESFSNPQWEAYFDEALPPDEMGRMEEALRARPELVEQLATIASRRDAGIHSLAAIWRRHRITCPPREQLGSFELGALDAGVADYVKFHLDTVGCRYCQASLDDLRQQHADADASESRRTKYFQSSAGYLSKED